MFVYQGQHLRFQKGRFPNGTTAVVVIEDRSEEAFRNISVSIPTYPLGDDMFWLRHWEDQPFIDFLIQEGLINTGVLWPHAFVGKRKILAARTLE